MGSIVSLHFSFVNNHQVPRRSQSSGEYLTAVYRKTVVGDRRRSIELLGASGGRQPTAVASNITY